MKVDIFEMFSTRSIGRDLLLGLVPIIVIVTSAVGSINYFINANRGTRLLQEQAEEATENLARILAHPIYNSKHSETALIGREYQQVLNVASLSIIDEIHNTTYVYDNDIQGSNITVIKPIMLLGRKLGAVEVAITMNSIIRQQKEFLYYTLVITVFTIISVGIASIVLLEMLLRKPFSALIGGVSSIAAGSYGKRIAPMKHHYMNLIAQNVNTMAGKIAAREQHLKIIVSKLEKQVVEREEAETTLRVIKEQFEEMTNLLPETVYETDERGCFIFLNRSGFKQFGWNSEDIKNGLKFIDLFTAQDRERVAKNLKSALSGGVVGSSEYLAKNKNGTTFQVLVHFNSIIHDGRIDGVRGIAVDITESKRIEKELLLYQENLRSLTNKLLAAEERERHRIASELHDRIGHVLTNVAIKIGMLRDTTKSYEKNIILKEINQLIEQSAKDVQSLIFEISPPILYDIGLVAAVDWLIEKTSKKHGLKIVLKHDDDLKPISKKIRALIFRAVRELLFNVIKHANAKHIEVSITRQERHLMISVQDDGVGMSVNRTSAQSGVEGFGLFSIRERLSPLNGSLIVHSKPHQGTRVVMKLPDS